MIVCRYVHPSAWRPASPPRRRCCRTKGFRMLTGNGRHRRPRQAPALIVAAGVTGSAIAIPLLGAASANAVDGTTWDKVAECESGGSWSTDTGNGYHGGLQIS